MSDFYNHKDDWYRIELNLNEHKDDTIKHITDTERQTWNAKSDAHDHPYAPLSHVGDATHLADGERQKWNSMSCIPYYANAEDVLSEYETGVGYVADRRGYVAVQLNNIPGRLQGLYITPHEVPTKHVKLFHTDGSGQYNEIVYIEPGDIIAIRTVSNETVNDTLEPAILTYIPFKTV